MNISKQPIDDGDCSDLESMHLALYRKLDVVQAALLREFNTVQRACLAIIEDDLTELITECEDLLIMKEPAKLTNTSSLTSRVFTVFEELDDMLASRGN